ncbi:MAG: tyrosine-type recombinase/integrase [Candidatus Liptonbacteria bacterium]|nr:tyrosine-type recombinase/integrase [Candidatus Liptonbacteria bacterium]
MNEAEKYLNEYLDYLEIEKGRSIKTQENYGRYLKIFLGWSKLKSVRDIDAELIRNFRLWLARREIKKNTQAYYIIALRNFLKYLIKRDLKVLSPDKIELPKTPSRQIDIPDERDLKSLLGAPDTGTLRGLRDKAILETLFSTGLRLSELCALNRYINLDRGELSVRGKGDKIRVVFFADVAKKAIKNYLDRREDAEEAMFVSFAAGNPALNKNNKPHQSNESNRSNRREKVIGRITSRAVQRMVDGYAKQIGVQDRITPHMLRHFFATDLLTNGADLRSVQELLGHANIATTQVYTHITNKGLKEVHKAFHGKRR